jgi:L-fuculose-phosphate aldolase
MTEAELRREVVRVARLLEPMKLSRGKSGNVSARTKRGFLVTPTGVPYESLQARQLVELDLDGNRLRGALEPSSEWRIHADIYRARPETRAVVHAHPPYATAFAIAGVPLEAVHYMIAIAGGHDVRIARYATFGTKALSKHVLVALRDRQACLMAHHGLVALGSTVQGALRVADEVEGVAEMQFLARTIGNAPALPRAEMARVAEKFKSYGQPRRASR